MLEPEVAWYDSDDNMRLQEDLVSYLVERALERCRDDLEILERDTTQARERDAAVPAHRLHATPCASSRKRVTRSSGATTSAPRDETALAEITTGRSSS